MDEPFPVKVSARSKAYEELNDGMFCYAQSTSDLDR